MTQNNINTKNPIVQIVNANYGTYSNTNAVIPHDGTTPQQTEGTELLTLSITPTKATNRLVIEFVAVVGVQNSFAGVALFKDSEANALAASFISADDIGTISIKYTATTGSTSPATFKIRYGISNGVYYVYINGSALQSISTGNAYFSITEYNL